MTPHEALLSAIFRDYVVIFSGVLAAGALLIFLAGLVAGKPLRGVWITFGGWLILAPLTLGCIFAGRVTTIAVITILSIFGFKEFARATGLYRDWWMTCAVYLALAAQGLILLVRDPFYDVPGWFGMFLALPAYTVVMFLLIPILRNRTQGQLQVMSLSIVGFLNIGWMFGHLAALADSANAYGYLLYVLFATEVNDVAAFTFGRLFGRHRLRSNISPNKTWEGALGALLVSMVLPWLLRFSFPHFGVTQLILTGLIVGIGGQLGDLSISLIKRDVGIKDMGTAIPGHGGLLDRMDSLIFVSPLFLHMVNYFYGLHT